MELHAEASSNGREAYNLWNQKHHDIVLTDCAMPLLDGFELARLIRQSESEHPPAKPVLLRVLVKTLERYLPQFREKKP
jgi:CheY-like chemotaxis protein